MNQSRTERVGLEVKTLHDMGYRCDLQQDPGGANYYLTVELTRDTLEGPQPARIYLKLDTNFPSSRPELVVTVIAPGASSMGELVELPVEVESKTRVSWSSQQMLYEIVQDVQDALHAPNLRLAAAPAVSDAGAAATAAGTPAALPRPADRPAAPPQRRSAAALIAAVAGGTALLLLIAGFGLYYTVLYDPCGADQRLVDQSFAAGDPDALRQAIRTLEAMRGRGQAGERGGCGALAADPAPLRAAYERYGAALLAAGQLDDAAEAYRQSLSLDPQGVPAQEGLAQVLAAQAAPLWAEVQQLQSANTSESWPQVVAALEQIRAIDPAALSPGDQISVTLSLARAHIAWGDLLLLHDPNAARARYVAARALDAGVDELSDRLDWAGRAAQLRAATIDTWPALIADLEQAAASGVTVDPLGRPIAQWRYDAHVGYGRALLDRGGAVGAEALAQADAALALAQEAEDGGERARLVKREAEQLLAEASGYQLSASTLDAQAWSQLLSDRRLPANLDERPVNLLVVAPAANLVITVTSASGTQQLVTDRTGVAFAALPSGRYLVGIAERPAAGEATLDLTTAATYLVRITPR